MAFAEIHPDRREFIADLAEDVWTTFSGERQVFVDGIIQSVGVGLTYDDYEHAFDGLIEHRAGRFHIFCNTAQGQQPNFPRVRFTLGHELAHYFIDEHRVRLARGFPSHPSFTDRPAKSESEQEADLFASHLLMPTAEFRKALTEVSEGLSGIISLASTFGVSIQSAAIRYAAASRTPCAVVMFRDGGKPWWSVSPELKAIGLDEFHRFDTGLVPGVVAPLALQDDPNASSIGTLHKATIPATAWFAQIPSALPSELQVKESAVRLRSRGVLTLLQPVL
jgi:hypothetical protein